MLSHYCLCWHSNPARSELDQFFKIACGLNFAAKKPSELRSEVLGRLSKPPKQRSSVSLFYPHLSNISDFISLFPLSFSWGFCLSLTFVIDYRTEEEMTIHRIPKVKQEFWEYNKIFCTVFMLFPIFTFLLLIFTSGYVLRSENSPSFQAANGPVSYQPFYLYTLQ